jgi:flagellar biosynthesis/type III secretory pathway chaperone
MNTSFDSLITLLRNELAGYGGLLGLFDEQQGHLWRRDPGSVANAARAIEERVQATAAIRTEREAWVRSFAVTHGQPAETTLRQLLPLVPANLQPLLEALVSEINHLVHRIRRRARQNQELLSRTIELQREALAQLRPGSTTRTYAPDGRLAAAPASTLRAAG